MSTWARAVTDWALACARAASRAAWSPSVALGMATKTVGPAPLKRERIRALARSTLIVRTASSNTARRWVGFI